MKKLTLLRHGKAESHGNGVDDFQRELVKKGILQVQKIAPQALHAWGIPDLVTSSPALRAQSTAEIFAEAVGSSSDIILYDQLYAADTSDIADVVRQLPSSADHVVITGHNPSLKEFAFLLLKEDITLKTGSCIHFTLSIERWKDFSITQTPHDQQLITP